MSLAIKVFERLPGFVRRALVRRVVDSKLKSAGIHGGLKGLDTMQTKSVLTSVTIWGTLLAVLGPIITRKTGLVLDQSMAPEIVGVIGGLLAVWGRMRATTKVTVSGE